ncbi:MAG TPA: hypothetical protein VGP82_01635 [Ktedonobacterales bacterium]|jgi:hypothetical protein|nr:hypothetical protein [Ktedonobacterales bacterium]
MRTTATVLQMIVRVCGAFQIILGLLFWTNNARTLVPLHTLIGSLLVLSLLALAVVAAIAGVSPGFVALAILWGLVTLLLGLTQTQLVPGTAHWVIQVLHLLIGLGAIGQGENLGRRIRQSSKLAVA